MYKWYIIYIHIYIIQLLHCYNKDYFLQLVFFPGSETLQFGGAECFKLKPYWTRIPLQLDQKESSFDATSHRTVSTHLNHWGSSSYFPCWKLEKCLNPPISSIGFCCWPVYGSIRIQKLPKIHPKSSKNPSQKDKITKIIKQNSKINQKSPKSRQNQANPPKLPPKNPPKLRLAPPAVPPTPPRPQSWRPGWSRHRWWCRCDPPGEGTSEKVRTMAMGPWGKYMGNLDSGNMCEIQVFEWFYSICLERDLISRGNEWARLAVKKNACHIFLAISIPDGLRRFIVQKSTTIFNFWLYAIEFTNAPRFMEFDSAEKNRLIFSTPQKSSWAAPRLTVMGSRISTWFRHRSYSLFQQLGNGG